MKNVVGVRFNKTGKVSFFDANNLEFEVHDNVIVDTEQGYEYGEVLIPKREIDEKKECTKLSINKIVRKANKMDQEHFLENKEKEKKAFNICLEKIKEHKLKMKLVDVEYKFDNSKIIFSFTAEGRVDFRELVRDLASIFRVRIELRQIGIRDEVKRIGGNGICGRELCCCVYLKNFETVSIKMAKEQNIALNPSKVTGNCGRLMCCLKYEQEVYEEKSARLPKYGAIVKTEDGEGEVCMIETLAERVKVRLGQGDETTYKKYDVKGIQIIKNGYNKEHHVTEDEEKELEELKKLEELDNDIVENDKY